MGFEDVGFEEAPRGPVDQKRARDRPRSERFGLDRPAFALALILLSALPLLGPEIPPLVDLPGHLGRYRVQLDLAGSPALQRFFAFDWALIGNLGIDLLVVPLTPLLGLEGAVRLVVTAIPPLTVAGFLWTAREVHGRIPPTALWALPLAYGYPFQYGFINFALSMALVFVALGLWLHLARRGRTGLRAALFVPIVLMLWVTHVYGWALFSLLAATTELVRQWRRRGAWWRGLLRAVPHGLVLVPPLLLMLAWRSEAAGDSFDWWNWTRKGDWLRMALRDRWEVWDVASVSLLATVIAVALAVAAVRLWRRGCCARGVFDGALGLAAPLLALAFVLAPGTVFGSAYADMRLVPFGLAVALLAIRPDAWGQWGGAVALAGLAFVAARTLGTTWSFVQLDRSWRAELAALDHVPFGARLVTFVPRGCPNEWGTERLDHLPSLALARRGAFANDQWTMPGAQLLRVRYPAARGFTGDPSQFATPNECRSPLRTIDRALREMPRDAFDYVWLVRPHPYDPRLARGLTPLWRRGTSGVFRVDRQDRDQ